MVSCIELAGDHLQYPRLLGLLLEDKPEGFSDLIQGRGERLDVFVHFALLTTRKSLLKASVDDGDA